jgi:alpha-mannosidase
MKDTFGVDSSILWLPDVFGYSAAMPQILKKSGIRAFVTTKLGWNDTNRMPHDLFWWEGIDGSSVVTYLISTCDYNKADEAMKNNGRLEYTYNGRQNSSQIMGTYRAFREKQVTDTVLTCYGFGDGGGGPTWEMLEMDKRLRLGVPGLPKTRQESVSTFMDGLLEKVCSSNDVPRWKDELYLEYHRGTYTSMGQNKRYNRQLEHLLREAEIISVCAAVFSDCKYPKETIDGVWKTVMLNQFHDILPGSSIEEVYQESKEQYEGAKQTITKVIDNALSVLSIDDKASEKAQSSESIC